MTQCGVSDPGVSPRRRLRLPRWGRSSKDELAAVLSSLDGQPVELRQRVMNAPTALKAANQRVGVLNAGSTGRGVVSIAVDGQPAQAVMLNQICWVIGPDGVKHGPY